MPRNPNGWWDPKSQRWYARLGPRSPVTGKPTAVMLRYLDGSPVAEGDTAGRLAAVAALLRARETEAARLQDPTVRDLCAAYLRWQADRGAAQNTLDGHRYHLNRFCKLRHPKSGRKYAELPAREVGPEDLWRAKKTIAAGSIRGLYLSVLACWRWAYKPVEGREPAKWLPGSNPLAGMDRPKPPKRKDDILIPFRAERKLLRLARRWAREPARTRREQVRAARRLKVLCLALIASTGCRPFEACELEWAEVDWEDGLIHVGPGRDKARKPDSPPSKPRLIDLTGGMLRALRLHRGSPAAHPRWVFLSAMGNGVRPPNAREFARWFALELLPYCRARGLTWPEGASPYAWRHTVGTAGYESEDSAGTAAALGHSPEVGESTYHHRRRSVVKQAAAKIRTARRRSEE